MPFRFLPKLRDPDFESKFKLWQASRDRWDFALKLMTAIILIVGAVITVKQYLGQRQQLIRQNEEAQQQRLKDFNTTIYRARLDIYLEATDTFSKFVYATDVKEAEQQAQRFWVLFDGKFSIVEDEEVKNEIVLLGYFVEQWEKCKPIPVPDLFQDLAYDFTQSCRHSLKRVFPDEFNPLTAGEATHPPHISCSSLPCVCHPNLPACKNLVPNTPCGEAPIARALLPGPGSANESTLDAAVSVKGNFQ